jgi:hypothetical protein
LSNAVDQDITHRSYSPQVIYKLTKSPACLSLRNTSQVTSSCLGPKVKSQDNRSSPKSLKNSPHTLSNTTRTLATSSSRDSQASNPRSTSSPTRAASCSHSKSSRLASWAIFAKPERMKNLSSLQGWHSDAAAAAAAAAPRGPSAVAASGWISRESLRAAVVEGGELVCRCRCCRERLAWKRLRCRW